MLLSPQQLHLIMKESALALLETSNIPLPLKHFQDQVEQWVGVLFPNEVEMIDLHVEIAPGTPNFAKGLMFGLRYQGMHVSPTACQSWDEWEEEAVEQALKDYHRMVGTPCILTCSPGEAHLVMGDGWDEVVKNQIMGRIAQCQAIYLHEHSLPYSLRAPRGRL